MNFWTIYDNPDDFPGGIFVARKFENGLPTLECISGKSLENVRNAVRLASPLARVIGRLPQDDPKIVEVWI